jgi:sulfite reductase alpha subunit-like flavoprotein
MTNIPFIPESAPFNAEQRAWLNGFLAGLFSQVPGGAPQPNAAPPKAGEPLVILFGSQTGSAEGLAKKLAKESEARGFTPKLFALNDYEQANLPAVSKALIISSTWGDGEPPDNAVNFWNWIKADSAPRLENLNFAVLGLGDKNYSDFCGASKKFDERLAALGAKRLTPRGECDVDYEGPAKSWIDGLWEMLGSGNGAPSTASASSQNQQKRAEPVLGAPKTNGATAYGKSNPFPAKLLKNALLNKPGSGKEVRHYEIALNGSGLTYEAGDALGVVPVNCHELVDDVLEALKAKPDENVKFGDNIVSLREALTHHFDITKPSQELIAAVAKRTGAPSPVSASSENPRPRAEPVLGAPLAELAALLAPEKRDDLKKWLWGRHVIDLLELLPAPMPVAEFIPLLKKLAPRLYSISSSPKAHPGEVHLTVGRRALRKSRARAQRCGFHLPRGSRGRYGVRESVRAAVTRFQTASQRRPADDHGRPGHGHRAVPCVSRRTSGHRGERQELAVFRRPEEGHGLSLRRVADRLAEVRIPHAPRSRVLARSGKEDLRAGSHGGERRRTLVVARSRRAFLRLWRCEPHGEGCGCGVAQGCGNHRRQERG